MNFDAFEKTKGFILFLNARKFFLSQEKNKLTNFKKRFT